MLRPRHPRAASARRPVDRAPGESDDQRDVARALERQVHRFAASALDPLTSVVNRAGLLALGAEMLGLARAANEVVALLLVRVEARGVSGDREGLAPVDHALADLARAIESNLRASDLLARVGAAEFCVVLAPFAGEIQAEQLVSALRVTVEARGGAEAGCWSLDPTVALVRDRPALCFEGLFSLAEATLRDARVARLRTGERPPIA